MSTPSKKSYSTQRGCLPWETSLPKRHKETNLRCKCPPKKMDKDPKSHCKGAKKEKEDKAGSEHSDLQQMKFFLFADLPHDPRSS